MRSFNKIWIPSADRLCRFAEITHSQEKILLKAINQAGDAYSSFFYALNGIMHKNSLSDFPINFNILDRLFYSLYTRVYCFGGGLEYILKCSACGKSIKYTLDLNGVIPTLEFLVKQYTEVDIYHNLHKVEFDIPLIQTDLMYRDHVESKGDNFSLYDKDLQDVVSFIRKIELNNRSIINLNNFDINQKISIFDNLNKDFFDFVVGKARHIKNTVFDSSISLLKINCVCDNTLLNYTLTQSSLDHFMVMIYNDDLTNLYNKELNFRTIFPGASMDDITPIERDLLIMFKSENTKRVDDFENASGDIGINGV